MPDADRIERLRRVMADQGLRHLVGLTGAFHNFLDCDPVVALTGLRAIGPCAALLDADGVLTLLVSPAWDLQRARERCAGVQVAATHDLIGDLLSLLRQRGTAPGTIGVAMADAFPVGEQRRLLAELGDAVCAADELLLRAGAVKSAAELADAREATRIGELGYQRLLEVVRPGMREFELAAELLHYMGGLGAPDNFLLMSASQHNQAVRAPGRRVLERGDVLLAEITPMVNNQFSQICRTVVLGPASDLQRQRFALQQQAMAAGRLAAVAGATVASVTRAMDEVIGAAGFADYCRPPYIRVRGHGLGNVSSLPGDITVDNEVVLQAGMIFVMHPNQYFPDVGYLMCGEPVAISADGPAQVLSAQWAELDQIEEFGA